MNIRILNIFILLLFILISAWIYPTIQGLWGTFYLPPPNIIPRNSISLGTWITFGSAIGSIICAFILALPLGFLLKVRPIFIGVVFSITACLVNYFSFKNFLIDFSWFVVIPKVIGEYFTLILFSILFSVIGCNIALKYQKTKG